MMRKVGVGRCADILEISDSLVLKLYQSRFDGEFVERAASIGDAVAAAGIPSPKVHGTERHGDRHGIVMERIHGGTLFDVLIASPDRVGEIGASLARLHQRIHEVYIAELPGRSAALIERIGHARLTPAEQAEALEVVEELSTESVALGHGDLHPANVMMDTDGEAMAIDWDGAMNGPAAYDVTRAYLLLKRWALAPGDFDVAIVEQHRVDLADSYLDAYLGSSDINRIDVERWVFPAEAVRRCEPVPEEEADRAKGVRRTL